LVKSSNVGMNYIETCKEIIKTPSDFYRKMSTTGGYTDPLTFAAISYLIYGILSVLVAYGRLKIGWGFSFGPSTIDVVGSWEVIILNSMYNGLGWSFILGPSIIGGPHSWNWGFIIYVYMLAIPVLGICFASIKAKVQYPIYKIFGGTGSDEGTFRVIFYTAAVMVLSWIPILGLILSIYSLYLNIVGGMIVHKVSMWKSTVAVLISIVLSAIVMLVLFALGLVIAVYLINGEFRWH